MRDPSEPHRSFPRLAETGGSAIGFGYSSDSPDEVLAGGLWPPNRPTWANGFFRRYHRSRERSLGSVSILPDWAVQVLQVLTVLSLAPLISGVIARGEAIVQQRTGPAPPAALLRHREAPAQGDRAAGARRLPVPGGALHQLRWIRHGAAPDPRAHDLRSAARVHGRHPGGGLILGGAGVAISIAAIDSGSPYAQLGSSRLRTFGALNEPTVIFVVFVVALTTHTDLPYVLGATLRASRSRSSARAIC